MQTDKFITLFSDFKTWSRSFRIKYRPRWESRAERSLDAGPPGLSGLGPTQLLGSGPRRAHSPRPASRGPGPEGAALTSVQAHTHGRRGCLAASTHTHIHTGEAGRREIQSGRLWSSAPEAPRPSRASTDAR